jgi:hypothetical protein
VDCKTLTELVFTAAIALFAALTWHATRTYAYIAGVTLFIQASKDVSGVSQGVDIPMAKRTMKALRRRFPRVYSDMCGCLNPETRKEIES